MSIEDIRKKHERAIVEEFGTPRLLFARSGSNEEKRKPLLSDEVLSGVVTFPGGGKRYEHEMAGDEVRNFYERLIDEGKLRVVEEVENIGGPPRFAYVCSHCDHAHSADFRWNFCPGCGNKIKR